MESIATFNTAFIALDDRDVQGFLDAAFRALRRKTEEHIKSSGTFSIIVDVSYDPFTEPKSQALQLEEVA